MEVFSLSLPSTNKLVTNYVSGNTDTSLFFDYNIHSPHVYEERKEDLRHRSFPRAEIVKYLLQFNNNYGSGDKTINNINKLLDPESVVVIGGQQAGLLTGPLYTIHKILSILKLAEEQESKLNRPVIPIFWIAGEDHDFAEINHVFIKDGDKNKKKSIGQKQFDKVTVSNLEINKESCEAWLTEVFETYGETAYTRDVLQTLKYHLEHSKTYVDFFAFIIAELFQNTGIVILNSDSKELREIESEYFIKMIENNDVIFQSVLSQQKILKQEQYPVTIDMPHSSANLFYHHHNERLLLEFDKEGKIFRNKTNSLEFTKEELCRIAKENPGKISNNVVTRPLMQELLFPTLAFISGPGEVAYWAELKGVFESWGIKMPPVVPRITITFLERSIETDIKEMNLSLEELLVSNIQMMKEQWIELKSEIDFNLVVEEAKGEIEEIHKKVRDVALTIDSSLNDVLIKNSDIIQSQLEFMKSLVHKRILFMHNVELNKFNRIETSIKPNQLPQERIWNIYYYINKYGLSFVDELIKIPVDFDGKHKIIKI